MLHGVPPCARTTESAIMRLRAGTFKPGLGLPAVIGPVQQGLSLARPAAGIARLAMRSDLRDMTPDGLPSFDLAFVFVGHAATHIVSAIPLEPSARVIGVNPTLPAPLRERLAGIDAVIIERTIAGGRCQLGMLEPACREFFPAIRHVFSAEDSQREQLSRRQLRLEFGIEVSAQRCDKFVAISLLHAVIHDDVSGSF